MYAYKFNKNLPETECPGAYDYKRIRKKYEDGGHCNFGMDKLLRWGYIEYGGWRYIFHDRGELKRYLYLLDNGDTGVGWAPTIKLLERNLHHKVHKAVKII